MPDYYHSGKTQRHVKSTVSRAAAWSVEKNFTQKLSIVFSDRKRLRGSPGSFQVPLTSSFRHNFNDMIKERQRFSKLEYFLRYAIIVLVMLIVVSDRARKLIL